MVAVGGGKPVSSALPTGGTAGQILNVAVGGTYAWTAPPTSGGSSLPSGIFIDNRVGWCTANKTFTLNGGNAYYFPMYVTSPCTVSTAGVHVTAVSGSSIRIWTGLFGATSGVPVTNGALGRGNTTVSAAGATMAATGTYSCTLTPGLYFAAVGCDTSGTGVTLAAFNGSNTLAVGNTGPWATQFQPSVYLDTTYGGTVSQSVGTLTPNASQGTTPAVYFKLT